ncbi:beta/gamma crystallin domain-containing protein [Neobacillus drentensis]|uniref:beta/gamma crystallin domain-containing protein n=1 Tax=Neobacillus drentensis TaxID=220684 RepID=UPI00300239A1
MPSYDMNLKNRFFEHIDGKGMGLTVYSGEFIEYVGDFYNDKISSISIAPMTLILFFEDRGFKGKVNYLENWSGEQKLFNIHKGELQDKISSIKTYRLCPGSFGASKVTYYEHVNAGGENQYLLANHIQSYVGSHWNDRISSFELGPHTVALIFEHRDFRGRMMYLDNLGNSPLLYNIHRGWTNDEISSIKTFRLCEYS